MPDDADDCKGHKIVELAELGNVRADERRKCIRILDRNGFPNVSKLLLDGPLKRSATHRTGKAK